VEKDSKRKTNNSFFNDEENIEKGYVKRKDKKTVTDLLKSKKKKSILREIVNIIVFLILASMMIRIFLIEAYTIPSGSMRTTFMEGYYENGKFIQVGDRLIATKFYYGIRIPILNISLPGITKPKRGDIIIFEHPEYKSPGLDWELLNLLTLGIFKLDNNEANVRILVKRCIGIPGDTIIIDSNNIYVNGERLPKVKLEETEIGKYEKLNGNEIFEYYRETNISKTYIIQEKKNKYNSKSSSPTFYIPKKGDNLTIKKVNTELGDKYVYQITNSTLENFVLDDELIEQKGYKKLFLDEMNIAKLTNDLYEHTIKYNYYFGMGDNRDNSRDSREWGLIREDLIFGSPLFIFFPFQRFGSIK